MAAPSEGVRGGRRDNSGRKRKYDGSISSQKGWNSQHKRIYLTLKIFEAWRDTKIDAGYELRSDSEFAAHLLSLEYRRRENLNQQHGQRRKGRSRTAAKHDAEPGTSANFSIMEGLKTSTPQKEIDPALHLPSPDISPFLERQDTSTTIVDQDLSFDESSTTDLDKGNTSVFTDDEENTTNDDSSEEDISLHNLTKSALEELNAEQDMGRENDSDSMEDGSDDPELDEGDSDIYEMPDENERVQMSVTPTLQQQSYSTTEFVIPFGPYGKLTRGDELYSLKEEYRLLKEKKFVCSVDLLLAIFEQQCQTPGCPTKTITIRYHFIGMTLIVNCVCSAGHKYRFCSSHQVNDIYANNLQAASSILLSGNQFSKVEQMAKFLNLEFLSSSTYHRFQRLYLVPEINEWWLWMRKELISEFYGNEIVVGGDGQCDSPGFNAKNLCYFMMELSTNYILDIEVLDKRHVGLVSNNMEKEAAKRSIDRLNKDVKIKEFVTDASTSVKALLETQYKDMVHSLDVWHKSKSIKKCLAKLGKPKAMKKIKDWSGHITKHFWHCSSACRKDETTSDEEALKVMKDKWIGLLHHICNMHEWLSGRCDHDEGEHDESLPWFDRRDKDFQELQKVILNPVLLASFKYYTRFRHTGGIECANSLGLVYTPKRTPFSYRVYKARRQLAVIDWNFHVNLPVAKTRSGDNMVTRKYNARTRQWDVKSIKVAKGYGYIPLLMANILRRRAIGFEHVTQIVALNTSDPGLIAPTIAHVPPQPTKEIAERRSRFTKK